jgi:hypothetical protein
VNCKDAFGLEIVVFESKDFADSARHNAFRGASGCWPSVGWEAGDIGGRRSLWRMRTGLGGFGTTGHDDDAGVIAMVDIGSDHDEDEGGVVW